LESVLSVMESEGVSMKPVALIVRDGWGYRQESQGNAVKAAKTPNVDMYLANYPWVLIHASGQPVGLPDGYQGSSEVGHLNMGAGRIVIQELKRINDGMLDGSFFKAEHFKGLVQNSRRNNSRLHLMGLLRSQTRERNADPQGLQVWHLFPYVLQRIQQHSGVLRL